VRYDSKDTDPDCAGAGSGFGGFLRSLLSGIPWSERAETTDEIRLDPPPKNVIRIDNGNGRTRILGEDRADIFVHATKIARAESSEQAERLAREIRVLTAEAGGVLSLEVEIPGRWNRRGRVDLDVRVPRSLRVEVSASNGRICAEGLRSSLRARSSNGVVRIVDVVGDVEVATSNAKVTCSATCGRVVARSSNGKIELEDHRGSVDAATSNGLIRVTLDELAKEGVVLATSNGAIVLELPEKIDADVDLRVDNGIIRNHRELCRCTRDTGGRLRGVLGEGGTPIRLSTSNGSISLR